MQFFLPTFASCLLPPPLSKGFFKSAKLAGDLLTWRCQQSLVAAQPQIISFVDEQEMASLLSHNQTVSGLDYAFCCLTASVSLLHATFMECNGCPL